MTTGTTNYFTFPLGSKKKIIISFEYPLEECFIYADANIHYIDEEQNSNLLLTNDCFITKVCQFQILLKKSINNTLPLHPSIKKNIGYLWNKYLHGTERDLFFENDDKGSHYWIGLNYRLCSSKVASFQRTSSWIFNDHGGQIILQINPDYPFHSSNPIRGQKFILYRDFMKNYKPLITEVISSDIAEQWKNKCDEILEIIAPDWWRGSTWKK